MSGRGESGPPAFGFSMATRLVVGPGSLGRLGRLAGELLDGEGVADRGRRGLVVSDPGIVTAGHTAAATAALEEAGLTISCFDRFGENPTTREVEAAASAAREFRPDLLVAVGGGSSMDCCKGLNFLVSCGGRMQDYRGRNRATAAMLPAIAVPTTAGTGSETQSFALVSDADTGEKMACGDPRAAFRLAVLDAKLTLTQPERVTALTGIDAIAHAVESHASTAATAASRVFSREAFALLAAYLPRVLADGGDLEARSQVQLAAAWAGVAIENSMLGAAHAMANPLTQFHGVVHGQAVGLALPHVVRFNAEACSGAYRDLTRALPGSEPDGEPDDEPASDAARLAAWLERMLADARLETRLSGLGLGEVDRRPLAEAAALQWTGSFNPRPVSAHDFNELYEALR